MKRDDPRAVETREHVAAQRANLPGQDQALHESGITPHWVIGTSIGAVNGALIAGNRHRLERLHDFWHRVEKASPIAALGLGRRRRASSATLTR